MHNKRIGQRTIALQHPPSVISFANIGGKFEGQGPLGAYFDEWSEDSFFGEKTWEKAESAMQKITLQRALDRARLKPKDLDYIFAGDLLNQCTGSAFALREFGIPFTGLYGACSTMALSLICATLAIESGGMSTCIATTSSHFCSAEKQFRFPLEYGGQRAPTAQWTVTGSGAAVLSDSGDKALPYIDKIHIGTIEDLGITDAANMGAAMAPVDVKIEP